jgi:hypothetical protein
MRREKLVPLQRYVLRNVQYDVLRFPYNGPVLRISCASHVTHEILSDPLSASPAPRTPHPAPRRLLSNLLRACALRTSHFLNYALNPCSNCYLRISFTLKLSLGTHTTTKYQGLFIITALLILRIRILGGRRGRLIYVY